MRVKLKKPGIEGTVEYFGKSEIISGTPKDYLLHFIEQRLTHYNRLDLSDKYIRGRQQEAYEILEKVKELIQCNHSQVSNTSK